MLSFARKVLFLWPFGIVKTGYKRPAVFDLSDSRNPLHYVLQSFHYQVMQRFLRYKAKINGVDIPGHILSPQNSQTPT